MDKKLFRALCRCLLLTALLVIARTVFKDNPLIMRVGINPLSICVFALLGVPGAAALFGIQALALLLFG